MSVIAIPDWAGPCKFSRLLGKTSDFYVDVTMFLFELTGSSAIKSKKPEENIT